METNAQTQQKRRAEGSNDAQTTKKARLSADEVRYWTGALRLTRTPGRTDHTPGRSIANTISMDELIDPSNLESAFIASFFIGQDELFKFLPFKHMTPRECPIWISRDFWQDADGMSAAEIPAAYERKQYDENLFKKKTAIAAAHYKREYGTNFNAVYPHMSGGCSHSKILLLRYPDFLRIVITTANLMALDIELGDNLWFIQDVRLLDDASRQDVNIVSEFEKILVDHARALGCPDDFLHKIQGHYDFSTVRARIVTSQPKLQAAKGEDPIDPESYGQLRLRRVIQDLGFTNAKIELESCTGSIGGLDPIWLHRFFESFSGQRQDAKITTVDRLPPVRIVYPTRAYVMNGLFRELSSEMDEKEAVRYAETQASNIGSHLKWKEASDDQKKLYHHFESKDPKRPLFHMKLLLAFPRGQSTTRPLYVYIGSANLSPSAWGKALPVLSRKKSDQAAKLAGDMRLAEVKNFECGVVIKGEDLESLLVAGGWEEIVPYQRPVRPYQLLGPDKEKPWNSPMWVKPR